MADRLFPDYEPPPLPPIGPDGSLMTPSVPVRLVVLPPSLCEQGPCAHYHEFRMPYDAAKPMDGSSSGDNVSTVRTCYPNAGVEFPLNGVTVLECGLWKPIDPAVLSMRADARNRYMASPAGQKYTEEIDAWTADQQSLLDEAMAAADDEGDGEPPVDENGLPTYSVDKAPIAPIAYNVARRVIESHLASGDGGLLFIKTDLDTLTKELVAELDKETNA